MILFLSDSAAQEVRRTGAKAARLASLRAKGFNVPDGFVVTCEVLDAMASAVHDADAPSPGNGGPLPADVVSAISRLVGPGGPFDAVRLAVRSSAVAEDLTDASFAGQYETFLDVRGDAQVVDSVQRCFASARASRVETYKRSHAAAPPGMAVLVQRLVDADAAGVAFTAHPTTGERDVVVVSAVAGIGESLVSGQATPEEWEVRGETAVRRRSLRAVLDAPTTLAVAELARRVAADAGSPQDIEWAYAGGQVVLLQARPMTALPEPVRWEAPLPGAWIRNFRLGEWLGDPVTPLFETWLLARVEARFARTIERVFGVPVREPQHIVVNGWYFYGLSVPAARTLLMRLPVVLWRLATHFRQAMALTPPTAHLGYASECRRWTTELWPRYERAVADVAAAIEEADTAALIECIERLADEVGDQFVSIVGVAGSQPSRKDHCSSSGEFTCLTSTDRACT
ncbi:MAG: PEP/pyruvate-binding domain-containing protein [Vicinamibacterales bacterium]